MDYVQTLHTNHVMRKTYGYMTMSLLISFLSSIIFSHTPFAYLFASAGIKGALIWLIILGVEFFIISHIDRVAYSHPKTGLTFLILFSAFDGATMAGMFAFYSIKLVSIAFLLASVDFASMALVGCLMKRSTAHLGKQLFAMVIALMVVWLIEYFIQSTAVFMIFSCISIVIFSLLTMCDVNKIKRLASSYGLVNGLAVMGALDLYIDFMNIFIDILNIIGLSAKDN